jgi:hypothetical protein
VFRSDDGGKNPDTLERDHATLIVNRLDDVFAKKRQRRRDEMPAPAERLLDGTPVPREALGRYRRLRREDLLERVLIRRDTIEPRTLHVRYPLSTGGKADIAGGQRRAIELNRSCGRALGLATQPRR